MTMKEHPLLFSKAESSRCPEAHVIIHAGTVTAEGYALKHEDLEPDELPACINSDGEMISVAEDAKVIYLPFADVHWGEWYYEPTKALNDQDIMGGYPDGNFHPQNLLTRAEFVTLLHRIAETTSAGIPTFTDISKESYYAPAVAWASETGIVNGTSEAEFSPNASLTREQLVTILYRYRDAKSAESTRTEVFADYASVSDYAKEAMSWAVENGIVTGKDGLLAPRDAVTRAEDSGGFGAVC